MTTDEKEFVSGCCKFKKYPSIDEYVADIQRCLTLSSWKYSEAEAKKIVEKNMDFIKQSFEGKEPADDVAAEVGYCCG